MIQRLKGVLGVWLKRKYYKIIGKPIVSIKAFSVDYMVVFGDVTCT